MSGKLLTEHDLEFLSLIGGCRGPSESTLVKIPHCWKSHVTAHLHYHFHYWTLLKSNNRYINYADYIWTLSRQNVSSKFVTIVLIRCTHYIESESMEKL